MEIGFAPAKESCLPLPILESKPALIMADVLESVSAVSRYLVFFLPCDDGDEEAFLVGVAISIGEVDGIVVWSRSISIYCGVRGCEEEEGGESMSEGKSPGRLELALAAVPSSALKSGPPPRSPTEVEVVWPESQSKVSFMDTAEN